MKVAFRFNDKGEYIEPIHVHPNDKDEYILPDNCTFEELPQPNWKPVFADGKWVESITSEELIEMAKVPPEIEIQQLKSYLNDTDFYYIRELETRKSIPVEVREKRINARNRLNELGL